MERITYELVCDECSAEYDLAYIEEKCDDSPIYCPFCGSDVDVSDIEEEFEDIDDMQELNFDDND